MSPTTSDLVELRRQTYELRKVVDRLQREVYQRTDPAAEPKLLEELAKTEAELQAVEQQRIVVQEQDPNSGLILDTKETSTRRGSETTGLEAKVHLNMAHVPTSFYHLLDVANTPLLTCCVRATRRLADKPKRRVRISSYIDGYSARAVNTFELAVNERHDFKQLPTLFPHRIRDVTELTRATLNVVVEDLDGKVELHETEPIWLLARTSAPLAVIDPQTGHWQDLTPYLGAFVTPNAPSLMTFLREAARLHPDGQLVGYQVGPEHVTPQVKALFDALKTSAEITYINSVIDFNPQQGFNSQRVRLPRESLADKEANCIDGTVLFASLLEGISMSPAIVLVPGHAFLAWETWSSSDQWRYLETTMIGSHTFEEACNSAEKTAEVFREAKQLRMWKLAELRTKHDITPME
jgi:hypothetical protein